MFKSLCLKVKSHRNGTLRGIEDDWPLWGRNRHLKKPVVFTLAGDMTAALGSALNEFDAHFILLELHKESVSNMKRINFYSTIGVIVVLHR